MVIRKISNNSRLYSIIMRKIKNWKLFTESVEDSVEDIKWMLVDYDYDESIYLKSESLIVYKLYKDVGDPDYFQTTERIKRLAKPEGWDVTFIPKYNYVAMIFYKGNLEECILNWLKENYDNLEPSLEPNTYHSDNFTEYCDESGESIFIHRETPTERIAAFNSNSPMSTTGQIVEVQPMLYSLPLLCLSKDEEEDVITKHSHMKLCNLLKSWFKESYDIDVSDNNIFFEE